jgi:hypothetical protein
VSVTVDQRPGRLSARLWAASRTHHDRVPRSAFITALTARWLPWKAYADWAAQQATRPELQLAVAAQIGQARARHNHGLSTACWAHDVDEAGVRSQRPTTIEEPTPGDVVGHHGLILT